MWSPSPQVEKWLLKPVAHLLCISPAIWLLVRLLTNKLGFNPVEDLTHETGIWSIRILLLSLAVTPLRNLTRAIWLTRFRRLLGLYAFVYAVLHFLVYFVWDQGLDLSLVLEDILERPYITVGFAALCLLLPLAITSTNNARRRLKRTWNRLHKLVYLIGGLAVLHFLWLTKADYREPLVYAVLFAGLILIRLFHGRKSRQP